ncbi:enoyl-CoA hydratase/isomerase family protein [Pseudarthrobacter sp. AG30]|uniref:enoyl-CoA hydratase/isomerase family protein n=1 Tax=Pseudarthrobacter sp. AG30 TaxID=2249742 RepID=UPI000D6E04B5|nr:enoyl-CoA hydratase/isomerase family protein [Pseudarthrobacter sp. AG30]RAX14934.1 enoyl-CoA hydratase/isomerase family protein [Pseudarthrobacter sp. AG30]
MSLAPGQTPHLRTEVRGKAGILTLERPNALNALSHAMIITLTDALKRWAADPAVAVVIVTGVGDRAFCAGGDIVALYHDSFEGGFGGARMWADEYALNLLISRYPKPYVALMHGLVLGGGIGISAHGSHRIVTDNTRAGMPETGIGFVPDVGGTYLLARSPGGLGKHLALTGTHVGPGEAIEAGLADFYVPQDRLHALIRDLIAGGEPSIIADYQKEPPTSFGLDRDFIDRVYTGSQTVEQILTALDLETSSAAEDAAKRIRRNSPLALKTTLESLRRATELKLAEVLTTEYRVSVNFHLTGQLREGVRAQVIDKDKNPRWWPATLTDVRPELVESYFNPLRYPGIDEPDFNHRVQTQIQEMQ